MTTLLLPPLVLDDLLMLTISALSYTYYEENDKGISMYYYVVEREWCPSFPPLPLSRVLGDRASDVNQ